jgi:hypothetical protein
MLALVLLAALAIAIVYAALHPIAAAVAIAVVLLLAYSALHHRHYRRHRRGGLTVRESMRGPFRTWISVSKRF